MSEENPAGNPYARMNKAQYMDLLVNGRTAHGWRLGLLKEGSDPEWEVQPPIPAEKLKKKHDYWEKHYQEVQASMDAPMTLDPLIAAAELRYRDEQEAPVVTEDNVSAPFHTIPIPTDEEINTWNKDRLEDFVIRNKNEGDVIDPALSNDSLKALAREYATRMRNDRAE